MLEISTRKSILPEITIKTACNDVPVFMMDKITHSILDKHYTLIEHFFLHRYYDGMG